MNYVPVVNVTRRVMRHGLPQRLHLDAPLLFGLVSAAAVGLAVLYSAGGESGALVLRQSLRLALGFAVLIALAQVRPVQYRSWSPGFYMFGTALLVAVLMVGDESKGAQRWLDLGIIRFQPSEAVKIAVPMMVAWYLSARHLPPSLPQVVVALVLMTVPVLLIAKQPDLGTSVLVASAGMFVLFLAGLSWRLIVAALLLLVPLASALWEFALHDYQRQRILTFMNPENDPLGTGYHIIQSTIAVGSGGLYGKGWLNGTQAHLDFLPERSTDFIFAVFGEEFGLIGGLVLLGLYLFIAGRGLYIATLAQDTFSRLLAGSLSLTFLVYVFVNIGMVTGLLPVVGVPLPLVSYGGTSVVTLLAGFGILMSIHTHRRLLAQ